MNPFWAYQIGQVGDDNKNQYLHPPDSFPYVRTRRAIHQVRSLSILFGVVTIWVSYRLASQFVSQPLALAAMAVTAFVPNFLLTTSAVSNGSLVIAMSVGSMLFIINLLGEKNPPYWIWSVLAGILGLGMLTKLSFWPVLPTSALAVSLLAARAKSWRIFFVAGTFLLGGVALLGSWWVIRNWRLYGDITGLASMWNVWGTRDPLTLADYIIEFQYFRTTFWANFGYGNIPMPSWIYILLDVVSLVGLIGLSYRAIRFARTRRILDPILRDRLIVLGTWSVLTFAALVWYLQKTIAVTGRQAFPVLPGIALALVAGWAAFFPRRERVIALGFSCGMAMLAMGALIGVLIPAYAPAPRVTFEMQDEKIQNPINWQIGNVVNLRGYSLDTMSTNPEDTVHLTLFWEPITHIDQNYTIFVHLFDPEGAQIGSRDTYPGLGNDPTIYWSPGEIIEDRIPVPISREFDGPYLMDIEVGLYDLSTLERLPVFDSAGNEVGYPVVGHIKLNQIRQESELPQYQLDIVFDEGIHLEGYSLSLSPPGPGDDLSVSLFWSPTERPSSDYTVFVQMLNSDDQIVGQGDGVPRSGHYPTSWWEAGEHFKDCHIVLLPENILLGSYHIRIGLYNAVSGIRLTRTDGSDYFDLPEKIIIP